MSCGAVNIIQPERFPYEWEFAFFFKALLRKDFLQADHQVGIASVVSDNFNNQDLKNLAKDDVFAKLSSFWKIVFENINI